MKLVDHFLSDLDQLDVKLWLDGERLRYSAPRGKLTASLRAEMLNRKTEILTFLRQSQKRERVIPTVPRDGDLPLSFPQQRLWFLEQLEGQNAPYNEFMALRIHGPLQIAILERCLTEITRRHEVLRTTFSMDAKRGIAHQLIAPTAKLTLSLVEPSAALRAGLSYLAIASDDGQLESQQLAEVQRLAAAEEPFDLATAPLLRAKLIRFSPSFHILLFTMHHIISDGWSIGIFWRELATLYHAFSHHEPSPLPELPIQYADFAVWQRESLQREVLLNLRNYWSKQLEGAPSLLALPTDRPRPAIQSFRGSNYFFALPKELSEQLQLLSAKSGTTLFMTLLAAFKTLLYRYSAQEELLVGTPSTYRNRQELESLIGFFANTLVLRTNLSGNPTFNELLGRVRQVALDAYQHKELPLGQLMEVLPVERNLSHNPLFQVLFALRNGAPPRHIELEEILTLTPLEIPSVTAKFDLTLEMQESTGEGRSSGLIGRWEYNTDLFEHATIERMAGHFQVLLEAIVANPLERIEQLPLLTDNERHQLLVEWNDTKADYPQDKCIHQLFEEQVERTPDAIAVVYGSQKLSYRDLNVRVNKLAHYLIKQGVGPEVLVGICLERSPTMVIGLLGILKAGGAYVPLDPNYPKERLAFMLSDSGVRLLLTSQNLTPGLPTDLGHVQLLCLESRPFSLEKDSNPVSGSASYNAAYVLYTSGSTGKPKGVAIEHRSSVTLLNWAQEIFRPDELAGVLASTSICFDLSVFEIFLPLSWGRTVILAENALHLPTLSVAQQVTLVNTVPSAMSELLRTNGIPQSVRTVNLAGEPLPNQLAQQLYRKKHIQRVFNLYGPSEDTTYSTFALVSKGALVKPSIGRPVANTQAYLLDRHLNPVPIGVPGELHLGGAGLARGYLNRPQLTKEKFIPNPFGQGRLYKTGDLCRYLPDGNIEFLGRFDGQVKIRGFRIELGEIEAVLSQHPDVRESVVLAGSDGTHKRLVAYFVGQSSLRQAQDIALSVGAMRAYLKEKVPDYMIPAAFVQLEALPLTPNGKVDRRALAGLMYPEISAESTETFMLPRTHLETILVHIWQEVLSRHEVGVRDNFFDLGGHSLLALRLMAKIRQQFGINLPLTTLFQNPTVAQLTTKLLAQLASVPSSSTSYSPLVPIQPAGSKPPFFCVHPWVGVVYPYYDLANELGSDQPFYGLQSVGMYDQPDQTIQEMATHYIEALRSVSKGPYLLGGWSFGGLVAFEMAQQLHRAGEEVALLALFDTPAPLDDQRMSLITSFKFLITMSSRYIWPYVYDYLALIADQAKDVASSGSTASKESSEVALPSEARSSKGNKLRQALSKRFAMSKSVLREARSLTNSQSTTRRMFSTLKSNGQAGFNYVPQPYPGRVTLFRVSKQLVPDDQEQTLGWNKLAAQGVDVQFVPGHHLDLLRKPHVQILAEHLEACIDQIQVSDPA